MRAIICTLRNFWRDQNGLQAEAREGRPPEQPPPSGQASGPVMPSVLVLLALVSSNVSYLFDGASAWITGWAGMISGLFFLSCAAAISAADVRMKASFTALAAWFFVDFVMTVFGATFEAAAYAVMAEAAFFSVSVLKPLFMRPVSSDVLSKTTYCYALAPIKNFWALANVLRPSSMGIYGGRVVVAGEYVYCIHKRRFKKYRLSRVDISKYTIIDTGEPLNSSTNAKLDAKLNERAIPFLNDCSTLRTEKGLDYILTTRAVGKWFRSRI